MTTKQIEFAHLRRRAEEKARLDEEWALKTLSLEDAKNMFHELRVYQIELEMQNEELRRTQHELQASRARYFDLYDLAPIGYLTLSEQGLILEGNLAAASMFGMERKSLLKKPISQFILREDQDVYYLHRKKVFETDELQMWEMRMVRADGSHFWARLLASLRNNGEYWIVMNDITELKRAEEAQQKSEKFYRSILQTTPEGYWITDMQGKLLEVNGAYCKTVGYTRDELLGMSIKDVEALENEAEISGRIQFIVENGPQSFESRHRRKDGGTVDLAISVNHLPDEDKLFVFLHDITENKQAERARQARMRISDYAFDHSLDELLTKVLDEAEVLTGSKIGFFHFVDADEITLVKQTWSTNTLATNCIAEGKGRHFQLKCAGVWADGIREKKPLIHNDYESLPGRKGLPPGHAPLQRELVVPIIRNDRIVAVLGVGNKPTNYTDQEMTILKNLANLSWDVIKRKTAEDEMRKAKEAAETANRAKSDFLATMSHEIRTPLSTMLGNIELLEGSPLTPQQDEYLEDCKSASQMLLQVINDVLDFSKIEAGKLELSCETFSVSAMSAQLTRMFFADARRKGIDLTASLADNLPDYINCDQQRLRQIISNLLSNAIKFTHQGSISLDISSEPTVKEGKETILHIAVKDTGIGIPADKLEHVFDSFTRVEGFSTRSTSGTGLGLPITRRLLALMGGSVAVSSVPGEGSVFTIDMPVLIAAAPLSQPRTQPQSQVTPRNILLADDDERGRAVAQKLLQRRGYKVTAVEDGGTLLNTLQKGQFDIVLTDISMPDMDGTKVARIIRSGELNGIDPLIPIIAMTAHAFSEDRDRFLAAGINGYVSKPINLEDLLSQIEKLCDGAS